MDVAAIVFQIIGTIIGSLSQSFFDKFCNKKISKAEMCQKYIQNSKNDNQNNSINNSFNNTNVQGDLTVAQQNIKITNTTNINASSNNSSAGDEITNLIFICILVFVMCLFFSCSVVYLKKYLYFDYWYLFLIVFLSIVASSIYYYTIRKNCDLYWNLDKFRSTITMIIFLTLIINLSVTMPEKVVNLNEILETSINNFTDIFNVLKSFDYSAFKNEIIYLAFHYILLFVPICLICMEIAYLLKYKKSFLTSTSFVFFLFGILYFLPDVIYYLCAL